MGLVFGILYVWSVIKGGIPDSWGRGNAEKALPYSMMGVSAILSIISKILGPPVPEIRGPKPEVGSRGSEVGESEGTEGGGRSFLP